MLAIGFSKKGGDTNQAWAERFRKDFGADSHYAIYPVAELEGAPRFIRGMIVGSMRKKALLAEQDHFITLFQGTEDLKRFVGFADDHDAYLLLLDAKGAVQWRGHGIFREQDYAVLQGAAKKLAAQ